MSYRVSLFSLITLSLVIIAYSCKNDMYVPGACYNQKIKPLIISNCTSAGCHNPKDKKEDLDLTTYEGLMRIVTPGHPLKSELYNVIRKNGEERMPPDHKMSAQEINAIKGWISMGATQNDCVASCDTNNITFSNQVFSILKTNCMGCHSNGSVLLVSYNDVKSRADAGSLLGTIIHSPGYRQMPETYQLSDCDIKIIKKWINDGAQNN